MNKLNNAIKSICVFCGASDKVENKYFELAKKCGEMLGEGSYELVYGGGSKGLMGEVANSAAANGSRVVGIFPQKILDHIECLHTELDETILVDGMLERKEIMIDRSDAFITLPGGFGTLDEFFEVMTLKRLGIIKQKIILVNYQGFWNNLISLLGDIHTSKFCHERSERGYEIADTLEECFLMLAKDDV